MPHHPKSGARTSLAVDSDHLQVLLRAHDPLDVLSKRALIRGQAEAQVSAGIDALLEKLKNSSAAPHATDEAETPDYLEKTRARRKRFQAAIFRMMS